MSSETDSSRPKSPASQLMETEIEARKAKERGLTERDEETDHAGEKEMNFVEHLDELRTRLIRSGIALVVVMVLCAFFSDMLVNNVLIAPLKNSSDTVILQNLVPYGQISLYLQVIFFSGFVLTFPFLVYQVWQFVLPGLKEKEKAATRFVISFISLSFFAGIAFGYFIFMPISLKFFAGFGTPLIENNIAVQDYVSFFMGALVTTGLVFELPFLTYILSRIGLLTPAFMRFYRKHAIVTLLVVAAIVTPSTDIVTQLVIAIPMILLYELSIWISGYVNRKNNELASRAESVEK
ncbi:MAG: twin-arginine translocase subunit TatC [Chlorobiales bacterium]|nr:twin-arginine translocase subunit TatC [Chlorobiales bacterium]